MEVESLFKYVKICFSKDEGLQEDMKMQKGERTKAFIALKMMFNVRTVNVEVQRVV